MLHTAESAGNSRLLAEASAGEVVAKAATGWPGHQGRLSPAPLKAKP